MLNNKIHQPSHRALMPALPSAFLPVLLLMLSAVGLGLLSSCLDENLVSTTYANPTADETDMYLSINVPRTYAPTGTPAADKENLIETLDVLVCRPGAGATATGSSFYVYATCKGTPTENGKTFQVIMPVGENFTVHVFVNCREELQAKDFYNSKGLEMNAALQKFTLSANPNDTDAPTLPMYGYTTGLTVNKDVANHTVTIPVLRSVAAVQVMTNTVDNGTDDNPVLTPGDIIDPADPLNKKKLFDLRELYVYFFPDNGQAGPNNGTYQALASGAKDETRSVKDVSLPAPFTVSDTRADAEAYPSNPRPYWCGSAAGETVRQLGNLYIYENRPWSPDGFDQPDAAAKPDPVLTATTRLVVGGVYADDQMDDPEHPGVKIPKVTYYRVDFATPGTPTLTSVLRNHKYTFNIKTVSGSGYDTPDAAATGVPINIEVQLIDWVNPILNVDFDRQNRFYSETKNIVLNRNPGATRTISVESDIDVKNWSMCFGSTANGVTDPVTVDAATGKVTPTQASVLKNARYQVEKAADGKSLTFTVLKAYNALATGENRNETLILKAKELQITYNITQADSSPDDWGNGGNLDGGVGSKGFEIPGLDFIVAPGNLMAIDNGLGGYFYTFTPNQGYFSQSDNGGDMFRWNSLIPGKGKNNNDYYSGNWNTERDACRKVGDGKWFTPDWERLGKLNNMSNKWGNFPGGTFSGFYYNTATVPNTDIEKRKYIFLPASGFDNANAKGTHGYYWSTTPSSEANKAYTLYFYNGVSTRTIGGRYSALSVRCIRKKE